MMVSVVIPTYNRAPRLRGALESALRQTHGDLDIIVVDDGSTDETREVVSAYGDRLRCVHQPNGGVSNARNNGIGLARGEFVAFLDSDDRWREYKLAVQLAVFREQPEVGLVFTDFVIEKANGEVQTGGARRWAGRPLDFERMRRLELERPETADGAQWPADRIESWWGSMYRQLLDELPILTSSVVVRRALLDDTTRFTEGVALFEDWEFFARVARKAPLAFVDAPAAINVGHVDPGRLSRRSTSARAAAYLSLIERVWLADADFVEANPDEARSAHGRALLAVAREALLEDRREDARGALAAWRRLACREQRVWAGLYATCARLALGKGVLRSILRARTLGRIVAGSRQVHGSVNPAA